MLLFSGDLYQSFGILASNLVLFALFGTVFKIFSTETLGQLRVILSGVLLPLPVATAIFEHLFLE